MAKIPASKVKAKHIGIEIEFFTKSNADNIWNKHPIRHFSELGDDGSITGEGSGYELRILTEYSKLRIVLLTAQDFLNKVKAEVNNTCGLHVHLDMRNFDAATAYSNLIDHQNEMIKSVPKVRRDNTYCRTVDAWHSEKITDALSKLNVMDMNTDELKAEAMKLLKKTKLSDYSQENILAAFIDAIEDELFQDDAYDSHYNGISADPLLDNKYKTLEVRFHEGTTDCSMIGKWVKYLYDTAYSGKLTAPSATYIKERIKKNG